MDPMGLWNLFANSARQCFFSVKHVDLFCLFFLGNVFYSSIEDAPRNTDILLNNNCNLRFILIYFEQRNKYRGWIQLYTFVSTFIIPYSKKGANKNNILLTRIWNCSLIFDD